MLPAISASSSASSSPFIIPSLNGTSQDDNCDDNITGQGQGQEVRGGENQGAGEDTVVATPAMLSSLAVRMREGCLASIVPAGGQTVDASGTIDIGKAVNKVLERTQTVG